MSVQRLANRLCVRLYWLVAVVAAPPFPNVVDAHVGDRVFPIYELPSSDLPDLHDGTLDDWEDVLTASLDHRDFAVRYDKGQADNRPVAEEEIAFQVFLAWHHTSQRVFVAVERFDATHSFRLPPEPHGMGRGQETHNQECCGVWDHIGLWVDGDHSGGKCNHPRPISASREQQMAVDNVGCQHYEIVPEADGARRIQLRSFAPLWAGDPPFMDADCFRHGESSSLSGYEFYVSPFDELWYDLSDSCSVPQKLDRGLSETLRQPPPVQRGT